MSLTVCHTRGFQLLVESCVSLALALVTRLTARYAFCALLYTKEDLNAQPPGKVVENYIFWSDSVLGFSLTILKSASFSFAMMYLNIISLKDY